MPKKYSEAVKKAKLKKYQALRDGGTTADKAAKKVGVAYLTILRWQKEAGIKPTRKKAASKKTTKKKVAKKKVARKKTTRKKAKGKRGRPRKAVRKKAAKKVTKRKPGRPKGKATRTVARKGTLTIVTNKGHRIEGLTYKDLVRFLKDVG